MTSMHQDARIVLASSNAGKVREINQLLSQQKIEVIPQNRFNISDVDETGLTFVENAILKARNAAHYSGLPAIADDSGIEVDFLHGAPGIRSARFAGDSCNDEENNRKLLAALSGVPEQDRTARFQCLMVYMRHAEDPTPIICQGTWEGSILTAPQGENGFGYDPLFWVATAKCSSAQLNSDEKNRLSHRGKALQRLLAALSA